MHGSLARSIATSPSLYRAIGVGNKVLLLSSLPTHAYVDELIAAPHCVHASCTARYLIVRPVSKRNSGPAWSSFTVLTLLGMGREVAFPRPTE